MSEDNLQINRFKSQHWILIVGILIIVLFDVLVLNRAYFQDLSTGLITQKISVSSAQLKDFELRSGKLIAITSDPSVIFEPINMEVRSISLDCQNPNLNAQAQIFYRTPGQPYTQENSALRSIHPGRVELVFGKIVYLEGIRADLTNQAGDAISCSNLTVNEKAYTYYYGILPLYGALIAVLVIAAFKPGNALSHRITTIVNDWRVWVYIVVIVVIDLLFNVVFVYDSAHYLWLADLMERAEWSSWDPLRNILFPMMLGQTLGILGNSQLSLLILLTLMHVMIFVLARDLILLLFPGKKLSIIILVELALLALIVFDPIVVGYYHVMLTEFFGATLAVFSVWLAVRFYRSSSLKHAFFIYSFLTAVLTLVAWHVKQSYFVATLTPYLVYVFCTFLQKRSKTVIWQALIVLLLISVALLGTNRLWNNFLVSRGNRMPTERLFSTWLESDSKPTSGAESENNDGYIGNWLQKYLFISNFWGNPPVLGVAYQNEIVAYRVFSKDLNNTLFADNLDRYIEFYRSGNKAPLWLNTFFQSRQTSSNVLYTVFYLALPILTAAALVLFIVRKDLVSFTLLALHGLSFANVLMHVLSNAGPLDRYAFIGYPLNLLALLIWIVLLIQWVSSRLRQSAPAPHPLEDHVVTDSEPNPDKP